MEGTDDLGWRKSSYSESGGDTCVEVGRAHDTVLVRDTKDHGHGQVHTFTAKDWRAFVGGLKAGTGTDS